MSVRVLSKEAVSQPPVAVLVDMDNTLYAYAPAHTRALEATRLKACRLTGLQPEEFNTVYKAARAEVKGRLEGTASSHSRLLYFQRMVERLGLKTQIQITLDLEQTYWRTFLTVAELFEDARDFLLDLRRLGVPVATITDLTAQIQFRKMLHFGIDDLFDFVVTSEEAGKEKPHKEPFALAVQKLGIASGAIWMIGDDPERDIEGARAGCGAFTFQKLHDGVELGRDARAPDVAFDNFRELRFLLAGCFAERQRPNTTVSLASTLAARAWQLASSSFRPSR